MIKYRLCLKKGECQFKDDCLISTSKRCLGTSIKCQHQGCQVVVPTKREETDGRLIIDALEGKFG